MTLDQKLQEVPSPRGLAGGDRVGRWGPSYSLAPQKSHRRKADSFRWSVQLRGPYSGHRTGHYFVLCQILPRRKRKHLLSDAVATSSSEAPANLRSAAHSSQLDCGHWSIGLLSGGGPPAPLWGVGDSRASSQPPTPPHPALDSLLHVPQSARLSVPLYSSVKERDDRGADGGLSSTKHPQPPGKADQDGLAEEAEVHREKLAAAVLRAEGSAALLLQGRRGLQAAGTCWVCALASGPGGAGPGPTGCFHSSRPPRWGQTPPAGWSCCLVIDFLYMP